VKGPQSALYGRNAFAGAVSMTTREPGNKLEAKANITVGSDERRDVSVWLAAPIVQDVLRVGFGFTDSEFDGTWVNNHPLANAGAITSGKTGGWEKRAYYGRLIFTPTDNLKIDAFYIRTDRTLEQNPSYTVGIQSGIAVPPAGRTSPFNTLNGVPQNNLRSVTAFTSQAALNAASCTNPADIPTRLSTSFTLPSGAQQPVNLLGCGIVGTAQNRFWVGEIPASVTLSPGETRSTGAIVVDPRAVGLQGPTEIIGAKIDYDLTDTISASYQYGRTTAAIIAIGSSPRDPVNPGIPFGSFFGGVVFDGSGFNSKFESDSHEVRIDYKGDETFRAFIGGTYSDTNDIDASATLLGNPNTLDPLAGLPVVRPQEGQPVQLLPGVLFGTQQPVTSVYNIRTEEVWSIYGFASYTWEGLTVTAEGRYTEEDQTSKDFVGAIPQRAVVNGVLTWNNTIPINRRSASYFTPRVSATYKFTPRNMVYASVAKGVKSGGLNGNMAFTPQLTWAEEKNWTYEIGTKNDFLDGRVRVNLSAFYTDWSGIQGNAVRLNADGTSPTGFAIVPTIVGNVGDVRVYGFEGSVDWLVTDEFRVNVNAAYNNSRYKSGTKSQRYALTLLCDGTVCPVDGDISGKQLERVPAWELNASASYDQEVNEDWRWFARADLQWQSKMYMEEMNVGWVPDRTLVNAALGTTYKNYSLQFNVRNLFDLEYVTSALALIGTGGARSTQYSPFLGQKRTFTVTAGVKF
jgi:iron complex outermembrane recepter protein